MPFTISFVLYFLSFRAYFIVSYPMLLTFCIMNTYRRDGFPQEKTNQYKMRNLSSRWKHLQKGIMFCVGAFESRLYQKQEKKDMQLNSHLMKSCESETNSKDKYNDKGCISFVHCTRLWCIQWIHQSWMSNV